MHQCVAGRNISESNVTRLNGEESIEIFDKMEDKKLANNFFWLVCQLFLSCVKGDKVEKAAVDNSTISQIKMCMGTAVWLWNGWIHTEQY